MKKSIIIFSLLVLLDSPLPTYAQRGFKVIDKAEQKFEDGKNKRALKILSKAEKMNYGFCGNARISASNTINLLRAKIYIDQKDYQLARNSLDSIAWGFNLDSIRIRTYQLEYGKDSLSNIIDTSFANTRIECKELYCFVIIPLLNGHNLRLTLNPMTNGELMNIKDEKKRVEKWITIFKESENYELLKESKGSH